MNYKEKTFHVMDVLFNSLKEPDQILYLEMKVFKMYGIERINDVADENIILKARIKNLIKKGEEDGISY